MRPHRTHLDTASCAFISTAPMFCKRLCELVAFSEGESTKAAFEKSVLRQVALLPAKRQSPKSLILFQGIDASGFHPTLAKPSRMAMRRNSPVSATTIRTRPRQSVGAEPDPLYGWLIYEAECADRLIRLHYPSIVALTGERLCLEFGEHSMTNIVPTLMKGSDIAQSSVIPLLCSSELPERAVNKGKLAPMFAAIVPQVVL